MAESKSIKFTLVLAITALGAALDYLIGVLNQRPSFGIMTWALVIILAVAIVQFALDALNPRSPQPGVTGQRLAFSLGKLGFSWDRFAGGLWVMALSAVAVYAVSLGVIAGRYMSIPGVQIGGGSPYDHKVLASIINFQFSSTVLWLIAISFMLAVFARPAELLPVGIIVVSAINSWRVTLGSLSGGIGLSSQLRVFFARPDSWILYIPQGSVGLGVLGVLSIALAACGFIRGALR